MVKRYIDLSCDEIRIICDYLKRPAINKDHDKQCMKNLYDIGIHKSTTESEKKRIMNRKYPTAPISEGIARIYFEKKKIPYNDKPKEQFYINRLKRKVIIRPDGQLINVDRKIWVECKMRRYHANGTAHEKIPNVPRKYHPIGGKVILFLMADDEHKFNKEWTKLCRKELIPINEIELNWQNADRAVLEKIILVSEVAKELEQSKFS